MPCTTSVASVLGWVDCSFVKGRCKANLKKSEHQRKCPRVTQHWHIWASLAKAAEGPHFSVRSTREPKVIRFRGGTRLYVQAQSKLEVIIVGAELTVCDASEASLVLGPTNPPVSPGDHRSTVAWDRSHCEGNKREACAQCQGLLPAASTARLHMFAFRRLSFRVLAVLSGICCRGRSDDDLRSVALTLHLT